MYAGDCAGARYDAEPSAEFNTEANGNPHSNIGTSVAAHDNTTHHADVVAHTT
jgi:hypothetical protein